MKVLSIVVFSVLLLAQSNAVLGASKASGASVSLRGQNPFLLHLRVASENNAGRLITAGAALLDHRWAVTTAKSLAGVRFAWVRYGAEYVAQPELVTEFSATTFIHPEFHGDENDIALINLNRHVEYSDNIQPIGIGSLSSVSNLNAEFCGWGLAPGEIDLPDRARCINLVSTSEANCGLARNYENFLCTIGRSGASETTGKWDEGSPLFQRNILGQTLLVGLLTESPNFPGQDSNSGTFIRLDKYLDWINEVTELNLTAQNI